MEPEGQWQAECDEIIVGMTEWRVQHPRATLREIEAAVDERLARLRAKMLTDLALRSSAADWRAARPGVGVSFWEKGPAVNGFRGTE